jgi:hypothetical protein
MSLFSPAPLCSFTTRAFIPTVSVLNTTVSPEDAQVLCGDWPGLEGLGSPHCLPGAHVASSLCFCPATACPPVFLLLIPSRRSQLLAWPSLISKSEPICFHCVPKAMVTSLGSLWTCLLCCPLGPWGQELRPVTPDTTEALCTAQHIP